MKTGINLLALMGLGIAAMLLPACQKPPAEAPIADDAPPTPAATPAAAAAKPIVAAAATPVPDPTAPPGVFFLTQFVSLTTNDGIVGLKPGQVVRAVEPGIYEVGGQRLPLRSSQVTNNLRIAREVASADAATQAALRAATSERPAAAVVPGAHGASRPIAQTNPPPTVSAPQRAPTTAARSSIGSPKLGAGTGFADPEYGNRQNARTDKTGRMYWRDSRGTVRYDF